MPQLVSHIISTKNCFVNLPQGMINEILRQQSKSWDGRILVKIQWTGNKEGVILAWSGDRSSRPDRLELGNDLAACLLLSSETELDVSIIPSAAVHSATRVLVEPASSDDWELLSIHAAFLEDQLINQVAVVHQDMTLPLWINTSTMIRITVKETKPHHTVQLVAGSEVIVSPKPRASQDDESNSKTQSSKVRRKTKILRIQKVREDGPIFSILCSSFDMHRLRWVDGLLVCVNTLSPTRNKATNDTTNVLKKVFARVYASKEVSEGHVIGHKNLVEAFLCVHQYSRVRVQPLATEDIARSISRIYLRLRTSTDELASSSKQSPSIGELGSALSSWASSEYPSLGNRPIPMMNGAVVSLCGQEYSIYFNLEFEDESGPKKQQQEHERAAEEPSLTSIANALPSIPGMPDMGAIDTIRDVYSRVADARARAAPQKVVRPLAEQMSSQDLFFVDPTAVSDATGSSASVRFRLGDAIDISTSEASPSAGAATIVPPVSLAELGGLDKEIKQALHHTASILGFSRLKENLAPSSFMFARGALFINGQHGSGKSMFANALAYHFSKSLEFKSHALRLSCSELSGARHDTITKSLESAFADAILCQPTVLVLDDLDVILPAEQHDVAQSWQLSVHLRTKKCRDISAFLVRFLTLVVLETYLDIILDFLREKIDQIYAQKHAVAVICVAQSAASVHTDLQHPHFFRTSISCPAPNRKSRGEILSKALASRGVAVDKIDFATIALRTEGYLGADLHQLVERAFYVSSTRLIEAASAAAGLLSSAATTPSSSPPGSPRMSADVSKNVVSIETASPKMTTQDILKAMEDFVPASLKGVTLQKSAVSWEDIGGLAQVRDTLKQTLEWPTKYSFLFKSTPIRQRSGILLYGPSGCGKTLLASAIAKECGLNFISVKGPELLNKYIGASEQSVRDMFARASAAAPCILFFDEFDAIAPRRGHDNTGVTDRVVNQFLTQLDGVEVIEGVYVLAATSRPDLIDPALLRPGRLDKCLFVGIPNREERIDILKSISRKMVVSKELDWESVADATENYTGADLQALLYNSQLEAIHSKLDHLRQKMLRVDPSTAADSQKSANDAETLSRFKLADSDGSVESMSADQKSLVMKKVETIRENMSVSSDNSSGNAPKRIEHDVPQIMQSHIEQALSELVPSISAAERKRYQQIYGSFLQSRGADFQDAATALQNQRQTLA